MPDLTLNQFREELPVKQAMELDTLIRDQIIREIEAMKYRDETTKKLLTERYVKERISYRFKTTLSKRKGSRI